MIVSRRGALLIAFLMVSACILIVAAVFGNFTPIKTAPPQRVQEVSEETYSPSEDVVQETGSGSDDREEDPSCRRRHGRKKKERYRPIQGRGGNVQGDTCNKKSAYKSRGRGSK